MCGRVNAGDPPETKEEQPPAIPDLGADPLLQQYVQGLPETERDSVVKARVGQGPFRDALFERWGGCSVSQIGMKQLLIASHIKRGASATQARNGSASPTACCCPRRSTSSSTAVSSPLKTTSESELVHNCRCANNVTSGLIPKPDFACGISTTSGRSWLTTARTCLSRRL